MSRFSRSTLPEMQSESYDRFARSMPASLKTFEEFQSSRIERLNLVEADLQAKREQELKDLQFHLQDLTMQLGAAQAALDNDERVFVNQKESLITEIQHVKTEADIKFAQAQVDFMEKKDRMQKEYDMAFQSIAASMPVPQKDDAVEDSEEVVATKRRLKRFEGSLRKFKQSVFNKSVDEDGELDSDKSVQMYTDRVTHLEQQKRELLQSMKDDEHVNEDRLLDLTSMMENQEAQFQREIEEMQGMMKKKEEVYRQNIDRIYTELENVQAQRQSNIDIRNEKLAALQEQIASVDAEYREKLKEASRVAERLKTALVNANLRKTQQLEIERQRSQEHKELMKETFTLQQQIFTAERQLQKLREEGSLLRRELSAKIGPRRTASLFM